MRRLLLLSLTVVVSLVAASGAEAVVVDINPSVAGQTTVPYSAASVGDYAGVALVPGTRSSLATAGLPTVASSTSPCDPYLSSDLSLLPSIGICAHGGLVMHANETFALTWDPNRLYGALTRGYMEQFLKDVADGSGTFTSPYAITSQYQDQSGRAANSSTYGGACIDYGNPGGYTCQFGNTTGTGAGNNYPANGCTPAALDQLCLTDAQVQAELATHLQNSSLLGHMMSPNTPELVLLTPPGVEICLDSAGGLCSANGTSSARFCSYHSQVDFGGIEVAYVVQPWTVNTACDEPKLPILSPGASPQQIAIYNGSRLVGPLSQAQIAAIVNPNLSAWFAQDGSEINDNYGCVPGGYPGDAVTVGGSTQNPYYLQPEFNTAGVIDTDPSVPACALGVTLAPNFVVPSTVKPGDVVQFDGSITPSTLIIPQAGYVWDFGDGTPTAKGASVEHSYAKGGTYIVKLTTTDRGGDVASVSQTMSVLGTNGQPVTPPPSSHTNTALQARLLLLPQNLRTLLRTGLHLRVLSNEPADGFVTLSISRGAAKRAHIKTGRSSTVVVGRGTVSGVTSGTVNLHVMLSRGMVKKLGHLRHVNVTVRLSLTAADGAHVAIDAAGRY
ncbi:MAG TPA: PKD domain-containing protein [Solirubrobacteraceae bacterium]|jgi:hypothetical protein|nr:PKD domain-containing protein [Solirubrobacteraceae bacterium]